MRHPSVIRSRGVIIAATSIAVLGLAAGIAYATIPDSGGVIHSCYNASSNPSGQLRVIDTDLGAKCAKNEKAQGIQGIQGIPGTPGAPGAAGTSDAYHANDFTFGIEILSETRTVISKQVPAGSYAMFAKMELVDLLQDELNARCVMRAGGAAVDDTGTIHIAGGEWVPLQGVVSGFAGGTIIVECNESTGHRLLVTHIGLTAIKVTTVQ
jgi:hypothetical protein